MPGRTNVFQPSRGSPARHYIGHPNVYVRFSTAICSVAIDALFTRCMTAWLRCMTLRGVLHGQRLVAAIIGLLSHRYPLARLEIAGHVVCLALLTQVE